MGCEWGYELQVPWSLVLITGPQPIAHSSQLTAPPLSCGKIRPPIHLAAGFRDQGGGAVEVVEAHHLVRRVHVAVGDRHDGRRDTLSGDVDGVGIGTRDAPGSVE